MSSPPRIERRVCLRLDRGTGSKVRDSRSCLTHARNSAPRGFHTCAPQGEARRSLLIFLRPSVRPPALGCSRAGRRRSQQTEQAVFAFSSALPPRIDNKSSSICLNAGLPLWIVKRCLSACALWCLHPQQGLWICERRRLLCKTDFCL